jgi:anti-anti-sigma regulatory factor
MTEQQSLAPCRNVTDCAGARLYVYARSLATVLRIDGEIDASNAELVTNGIRSLGRLQSPLILDLSCLNFLGVEGFRALLAVNRERHDAGLHCCVVAGPATRLLIHIVKGHGLAIVGSVPEALQLVDDDIQARRQFVSGLTQKRAGLN